MCALVPVSGQAQQLECNPCRYHFGNVQIGSSANYSFLLTNIDSKTLRITAVSVQGTSFSWDAFSLPARVGSNASIELPVVFSPTVIGRTYGTITITSNDPKSPMTINMFGDGISPNGKQLTVSPSTLNFGNVSVGSTANLAATLTASGGVVTVSAAETNSSEFSITGLNLPVRIPPGQSVQATIEFTPNQSGTATAKAGFSSNAEDSPAIEQLTGTGVADSSHQVDLTWEPGAENVVGYNIFRGTTHGGPYQQLNAGLIATTNYTDSTVVGGKIYYYVATEVNNEGQQSGYSAEASAKVPKD